jgi:hypothetical protein
MRIARAVATNQFARLAPRTYIRLTRQTGRGTGDSETPADIAKYFRQCVDDYFEILGVTFDRRSDFLRDKIILEYGPGDFPGVALLMVANGAEKVYCVDHFSMVTATDKNARVVDELMSTLPDADRQRLRSCFNDAGDLSAGFSVARIDYLVRPSGLSGLRNTVDLVISRAVLEHVNNLAATFRDMVDAMREHAIAVHQVDLKSHGLHLCNPLDFLNWHSVAWGLMYSHKGVPNRFRVNHYRKLISELPVKLLRLEATTVASMDDVAKARPYLAEEFRGLSDEDLSWLGFWLVFAKAAA